MSKRTIIIGLIALVAIIATYISFKNDRLSDQDSDEPGPEPERKPRKQKAGPEPEPEKTQAIPGAESTVN